MSSTNRSNARKKHQSDYYITPIPSITDFLMEFHGDCPELDFNGKKILDPCAGGDSAHEMSYPSAIKQWNYSTQPSIDTIDIREDSQAAIKRNYLLMPIKENYYDVIITNPPFNIALGIIQKALEDVKEGGLVIMLLRLNFFGSQVRTDFWDKTLPTYTYVHSKRMKFTETGTDSVEYMHCVWIKNNYPKFTNLRII